jgi:hypothetical protein
MEKSNAIKTTTDKADPSPENPATKTPLAKIISLDGQTVPAMAIAHEPC